MTDWQAERYDAWYSTPLGALSDSIERELLFSMASARKGERALDLGCGTGSHAIELAGRGVLTIGFDLSMAMLERAGRKADKAGAPVAFMRGEAVRLPFADSVFDLAISVCALGFVKERALSLLELRRVLKPGGRLVVCDLNSRSTWALVRRLKGLFTRTVYDGASFISPAELESGLSKAGFKVSKLVSRIHYPPIDSRPILAFAGPLERLGAAVAPRSGAFVCALAYKN